MIRPSSQAPLHRLRCRCCSRMGARVTVAFPHAVTRTNRCCSRARESTRESECWARVRALFGLCSCSRPCVSSSQPPQSDRRHDDLHGPCTNKPPKARAHGHAGRGSRRHTSPQKRTSHGITVSDTVTRHAARPSASPAAACGAPGGLGLALLGFSVSTAKLNKNCLQKT